MPRCPCTPRWACARGHGAGAAAPRGTCRPCPQRPFPHGEASFPEDPLLRLLNPATPKRFRQPRSRSLPVTPSGPATRPPPLPPPSSPGCPAGEAPAVPASPPADISRRLPPRRQLAGIPTESRRTAPARMLRAVAAGRALVLSALLWRLAAAAAGGSGGGGGGGGRWLGRRGQAAGARPRGRGDAGPRGRGAGGGGPRLRPGPASAPGRRSARAAEGRFPLTGEP